MQKGGGGGVPPPGEEVEEYLHQVHLRREEALGYTVKLNKYSV